VSTVARHLVHDGHRRESEVSVAGEYRSQQADALAIRLAIYCAEHPRIRSRETDGNTDVTCYNRTQHNPSVLLSSDYG
jgi:hypothetical protein